MNKELLIKLKEIFNNKKKKKIMSYINKFLFLVVSVILNNIIISLL